MSSSVEQQVEALSLLDLESLRAAWRAGYGHPPALRSVELMRFMLAWRIQTKAHGGLDAETRRKVRRRGRLEMEGLSLGVGAVLRREWQGGTVEVEIVDGGFRWNGRQFRSLSAAATAIAGTRWNGPRFFGLREQAV